MSGRPSPRASEAWAELSIFCEGQPVALQTLASLAAWLRSQGQPGATVAADVILLAVDCYLREQGLLGFQASDVFVDFDLSLDTLDR